MDKVQYELKKAATKYDEATEQISQYTNELGQEVFEVHMVRYDQ